MSANPVPPRTLEEAAQRIEELESLMRMVISGLADMYAFPGGEKNFAGYWLHAVEQAGTMLDAEAVRRLREMESSS